jgi:hypothetical protein
MLICDLTKKIYKDTHRSQAPSDCPVGNIRSKLVKSLGANFRTN